MQKTRSSLQKLNALVDDFRNKNKNKNKNRNNNQQKDKTGRRGKPWAISGKAALAASTLLYFGLSPLVATPLYYKALFFPIKYPSGEYETIRAIDSVPVENVYFKSKNGNKLHGWFFKAPGAKYTALLHHGSGCNLTHLGVYIDQFLKNHISILVYDYQGYGKSEGEPSVQNTVDDSRAAYEYLTNSLHIVPQDVIHVGISYGTGLAGQLEKSNPGRAVMLVAPYATLFACARLRFPFLNAYPDFLMAGPNLSTVDCARDRKAPLFMVHGEDDWIVPVSQPDSLYAQADEPKEYLRMKGFGHGNFLNEEFYKRFSAFLQKL